MSLSLSLSLLLLLTLLLIDKSICLIDDHSQSESQTNNKIKEISESKLYTDKHNRCISNKDLFPNEPILKIDHDNIICEYDLFPYKFEFAEMIEEYYNKHEGIDGIYRNIWNSQISKILFAIQMMIYSQSKEVIESIFSLADSQKKGFYKIDLNYKQRSMLESIINEDIISTLMFEDEEKEMIKELKIFINEKAGVKNLHAYIISKLTERKRLGNVFIPILDRYDMFVLWISVSYMKTLKLNIKEYEKLKNLRIRHDENYSLMKRLLTLDSNKDSNKDNTNDMFEVGCLIPYISICSSNSDEELKSNEGLPLALSLISDSNQKLNILINNDYPKGSIVSFPLLNNEDLSFDDFQIRENEDESENEKVTKTRIELIFNKTEITKMKETYMLTNNLIHKKIYDLVKYSQNENFKYSFYLSMNRNEKRNKIISNFVKIYFYIPNQVKQWKDRSESSLSGDSYLDNSRSMKNNENNEETEETDENRFTNFLYLINNNYWYSFDNEIKSISYILFFLKLNTQTSLNLYSICQSISITKQYYMKMKTEAEGRIDKNIKRRYLMRKRLMNIGRQIKKIVYVSIKDYLNQFRKVYSDQFRKLKRYYLEDVSNK